MLKQVPGFQSTSLVQLVGPSLEILEFAVFLGVMVLVFPLLLLLSKQIKTSKLFHPPKECHPEVNCDAYLPICSDNTAGQYRAKP